MRLFLVMVACCSAPALACPDAGVELPPASWASSAQLEQPDGGVVATQGPGCWLPETLCEANGCELEQQNVELADLRAQLKVLSATPPLFSPGTWAAIGLGAAIALLLGILGGWEFRGFLGGR